MKWYLFLFVGLLSCSSTVNESTSEKKVPEIETKLSSEIQGKWEIVSDETVKSFGDWAQSGYDTIMSLLDVFGATTFSESPGKFINFLDSGRIETDLVPQSLVDQANFRYTFDRELGETVFTMIHPKEGSELVMPTPTEIDADKMYWILEDFIRVEMHRKN